MKQRYLKAMVWLTGVYCAVLTAAAAAQTLPAPPTIGSQPAPTTSDPVAYMVDGIKYFIFAAYVILAAVALIVLAGGLIREVNDARQRGEWGKFGAFLIAGLFTVLIVLAAGWWGSDWIASNI